jgi:outer membrane protein OmpA-like peptidoglycan-associated protein
MATTANLMAQDYHLVQVVGIVYGNETNDALYKASSPTIPKLAYIRAQRIKGPQDGFFTQNSDNIRYTSISKEEGIPANLSSIRFTFLTSDRITPIQPANFRFVINDIDGPNNEALAVTCEENLKFLGTANPTNINVINMPPIIIAVGSIEENDGPTSRVMFEFENVSVVELNNYANKGYLKDFDMNDDYPINKPILVRCKGYTSSIYTELDTVASKEEIVEFKNERNLLMVNTPSIYFDEDKFEIRKDAEEVLEMVLNLLNKYPELIIEIGSHTDSRANDTYNIELSENRAKASIAWFVDQGIKPTRIFGKGYGETQLVNNCTNGVKCSNEEHGLNRRTEFVIVNPEVLNE